MKKILLICVILLALFICSCDSVETEKVSNDNKSTFIIVETNHDLKCQIVYEKNTKVMYAISIGDYNRGNVTVMLNADGTPMLWEDTE